MRTFSKNVLVLLSVGAAGYAAYASGLLPLSSIVQPYLQGSLMVRPVGIYSPVLASFQIINQKGLTLMEIIAALIILGILAALAVPRYIDLESNTRKKALDNGLKELNALEILSWSDQKISGTGYSNDTNLFGSIDYNIGNDYVWDAGDPKSTGGTMSFKGKSFTLSRKVSTWDSPAIWERAP